MTGDYLTAGYSPRPAGCTFPGCGTQQTTSLDGVHGRRCAEHRPAFSRKHYEGLVHDRGAVWAYIRTVLRLLP